MFYCIAFRTRFKEYLFQICEDACVVDSNKARRVLCAVCVCVFMHSESWRRCWSSVRDWTTTTRCWFHEAIHDSSRDSAVTSTAVRCRGSSQVDWRSRQSIRDQVRHYVTWYHTTRFPSDQRHDNECLVENNAALQVGVAHCNQQGRHWARSQR